MAQWQNPYCRADLADTGEYPRKTLVQVSPDLFDHGADPAPDPAVFVTDGAWARAEGGPAVDGRTNHLYARGRNLSARAAVDIKIRLHCTPANLVLWPRRPDGLGWEQNPLTTGDGRQIQYADARAQGRFVTGEPFELVAAAGTDYSLVGWLESEAAPNPVPDPTDIAEVAGYFRRHPDAAAFHLPAAPRPAEPAAGWQARLGFYQGTVARQLLFSIAVLNGRAGDAFRIGSDGGEGEQPVPPLSRTWTITREPETTFDYRTQVPAGWTADIVLDYLPAVAGDGVPEGFGTTVTAYCVVEDGDPAAEYAVPLTGAGRTAPPDLGGGVAVPVGAVRYRV